MPHRAISALQATLCPHVGLSKSRLETLCLMIVGMISSRTVNLSHLASERPGAALIASTYRRLQRFFQHVFLPRDWSAPLVIRLLGLRGRWRLALDRTQWKVGAKDVNILMLAVITPRFRVPLMWTLIEGAGTSDSDARIALMRRYLGLFGAASVELLLADREFVGRRWLRFLNDNNIRFAVRLKEKLIVTPEDSRALPLRSLLRTCRKKRVFRADLSRDPEAPLALNFAAKRIRDGELLIVVSNTSARAALDADKSRWAIECLFGDTKTRGLNLEDTRLTEARKLDLLLALVALAVAWAGRTASLLLGRRTPKRKPHGYFAKSWLRTGFDQIRRLLRTDPPAAVVPWRNIPRTPLKPARVV
jgi:hypothetical protein